MNNHTTIHGDLIRLAGDQRLAKLIIIKNWNLNTWLMGEESTSRLSRINEICFVVSACSDEVATTAYVLTPNQIGWIQLWESGRWNVLDSCMSV